MWILLIILIPLMGLAYVGWHVWMLLPLAAMWKGAVIAVGVICFLLLPLDLSGTLERLPLPLARLLYEIGTSSILVLLYLFMVFLLLDVGRFINIVPRTWLYANGVTVAALSGILITVFLFGNIHYNNKVRVTLDLRTAKPLKQDYTIVMASDLHLGYHNTRRDLTHWIDLLNAEHPDFVLIAGDIIDISVHPLLVEDMATEFRRIQAPVYACLGNHEYYSNEPQARAFYEAAGIHLLRDSCAVVKDLCIIGRDDRTNPHRTALPQLLLQADTSKYCILLDHQPYHLEQTERAGIDFQLSGHTHEGQIWPISWITHLMYECAWGSHQRGNTQYYVSSGLGIWGGKFRIGTQSEYIVMRLCAGQTDNKTGRTKCTP